MDSDSHSEQTPTYNYMATFGNAKREGVGFKVFRGVRSFEEAVEMALASIEPLKPLPAKPTKSEFQDFRGHSCSLYYNLAVERWRKEVTRTHLENAKARIKILAVKPWHLD